MFYEVDIYVPPHCPKDEILDWITLSPMKFLCMQPKFGKSDFLRFRFILPLNLYPKSTYLFIYSALSFNYQNSHDISSIIFRLNPNDRTQFRDIN